MAQHDQQEHQILLGHPESVFFFYSLNSEGAIYYVSTSVTHVLGYKPEEYSVNCSTYLTDNPLNQDAPNWNTLTESFSPHDDHPAYEIEVTHKNGAIRRLLMNEILVFGKSGMLQHVHGIALDITSYHLKDLQLKTSERLLKRAERLAKLGHWLLDMESNQLYWSEEIYSIFGLDPEKFKPSYDTFLEIVHQDDKDYVHKRFSDSLNRGSNYKVEHRIIRPSDNKTRMVHEFCEFMCDRNGKVIKATGAVQDITDIRHAELEKLAWERSRYDLCIKTINALSHTIEFRDPYTAGHQHRVACLALAIGRKLGFSDRRLDGLQLGAMIHDIGKITIPMEILIKPGRIRDTEFELIKEHPITGFNILKDIEFAWPVHEMVIQHHEKLDGSGYPNRLSGDEIILEARILTVADVADAITSHRPYRPALGMEKAINILKNGSDTLFDSTVVEICIELISEKGLQWS